MSGNRRSKSKRLTADSYFTQGPTAPLPTEYVEYQQTIHEYQKKESIALNMAHTFYNRRNGYERQEQAERAKKENTVDLTGDDDDRDRVSIFQQNHAPPGTFIPIPMSPQPKAALPERLAGPAFGETYAFDSIQDRSNQTGMNWPPLDLNHPILATHDYEQNINLGRPYTIRPAVPANLSRIHQQFPANNKHYLPYPRPEQVKKPRIEDIDPEYRIHEQFPHMARRRAQGGMVTRSMARYSYGYEQNN